MALLVPQRVKYRKRQRGRRKGKALEGNTLEYGLYGLQALEPAWITNRQIEAVRLVLTKKVKKNGRIWIRIFPDKPVTRKPQESRQGGGKGAPDKWVAVVKRGRILFEFNGVDLATAKSLAEHAANKLPIKVRFVTRDMDLTNVN
jgi:large subunit ribosomal protein L16